MRSALSTLTTRGRAFLSAGVTSAGCAVLLGQRDLLRVGVLLVLLPLITALFANRSRYLLASSRDITPARIQVGQTATVTIRLDNPGRVPTGLMLLEDSVPYVLGSRPRFVLDQLRPRWHREMSYSIRSEVRGRYHVGPLTVRLSDPFGLVELTRAFTSETGLVVTPVVVPLPRVKLSGDWSGTGENRPRAFAAAGSEDVTVREYRLGDDLRRIHWASTARADELMVRREEQPHQSRATVVIDTRASAHRGTGPASSFEYAVSATASIGSHLAEHGFTVRMLTDDARSADTAWHDRGISGPAEVETLLDALAVIQPSSRTSFAPSSVDRNSTGLVVAVVGQLTRNDVATLSSLRAGATRALAIVVDTAAWGRSSAAGAGSRSFAAGAGSRSSAAGAGASSAAEQADALRRRGWSAVVVNPRTSLEAAWRELAGSVDARSVRPATAILEREGPAA